MELLVYFLFGAVGIAIFLGLSRASKRRDGGDGGTTVEFSDHSDGDSGGGDGGGGD